MSRDVELKDAPSANFDDDKHIDQLKRGCYYNEEVARDDRFGMVPHECHPALLRIWRTYGHFRHVASYCTRRNSNADFNQQFIGDASLTPRRIADGHFGDQLPQFNRHPRSAAGPGFPFPKQTKALAMPTNQRVGFDDDERILPIETIG